jgi:CDP-paratose 2-epimerase
MSVSDLDGNPAAGRWTLITGGAGFIGSNLTDRLASDGRRVRILDNLSRAGVERNAEWLKRRHGGKVDLLVADVREPAAVAPALADVGTVFHFAAQVAVTTSLCDPGEDFRTNLAATVGLLEAIRRRPRPPRLFFTSTNKVYGGLPEVELRGDGSRYQPVSPEIRDHGISERHPLDFCSPYGCSKGAADQYVLDYARSFGLETVVFRMSCIYGPRQFGTEDQGWVAHFLLRALAGRPITLYGDGRQVRDVLFVDDLVEAFLRTERRLPSLAGQAFNVGGGPPNTLSLLELLGLIEELTGSAPEVHFEPWRTSDQRYYISDTRRLGELAGWRPRTGVREGVARLLDWLRPLASGREDREAREAPTPRRSPAAGREPDARQPVAAAAVYGAAARGWDE